MPKKRGRRKQFVRKKHHSGTATVKTDDVNETETAKPHSAEYTNCVSSYEVSCIALNCLFHKM